MKDWEGHYTEKFLLDKLQSISEILEEWYVDISNKSEEAYYNRIAKVINGSK
jgi:hypothetical protein